MRDAAKKKVWHTLRKKRDYKHSLLSVQFAGTDDFLDHTLEFANGLTVLCGANGVGKSTLAKLIAALLTGQTAKRGDGSTIASSGTVTATVVIDSSATQLTYGTSEKQPNIAHVEVIDPILTCAALQRLGEELMRADEVLDGYTPQEWSSKKLMQAAFVVGRSYTRVDVYESDIFAESAEDSSDEILPFFVATCDGIDYDSRSMGLGELIALFVLWYLDQVEPGSFVCIEEPETALSPMSQQRLMTHLASECISKGLWCFVTTHSPAILTHIDREHIRLVSRLQGKVTSAKVDDMSPLRGAIGAEHPLYCMIAVEDVVAKCFLEELLISCSFKYRTETEINILNNDAGAVAFVKVFPDSASILALAVLDGDSSATTSLSGTIIDRVLRLPGAAPESEIHAALVNDTAAFAAELGRDENAVRVADSNHAGADHHDWLEEMRKSLGLDKVSFVAGGVRAWLQIPHRRDEAVVLVERIEQLIEAKQMLT